MRGLPIPYPVAAGRGGFEIPQVPFPPLEGMRRTGQRAAGPACGIADRLDAGVEEVGEAPDEKEHDA